MVTQKGGLGARIGVIFLFLVFVLAGCGQNSMGPTAPTQPSAQTLASAPSANFNAACVNNKPTGHRIWTKEMLEGMIWKFVHPGRFSEFCGEVLSGYLTSPEVLRTFHHVVSSRIFNIIIFQTGAGNLIASKALRIVSQVWYPGLGSSPNGFSPEVTLLPFAWSAHRGFSGGFLTAWGDSTGYHLDSYTPAGDHVRIETQSGPGNIYRNEKNFSNFSWYFTEITATGGVGQIFFAVISGIDNRLALDYTTVMHELNDGSIFFSEVWASVKDRSGRCRIFANDGTLDMDLTFDATGAGGGYVTVLINNQLDRYDFLQAADGRGTWTKNGGRKHPY
jgi:hypothetical protein